ncbi:MAG: right-handed parallel beta-helix repeat-containing protein [Candidatus Paceibacterota bacterium]
MLIDRYGIWHSMGIGQNIGHATRMSVNNNSSGYIPVGGIWSTSAPSSTNQGNGFMTLLGDPSLRAEYIAPVSSLTLSNSGGKTAMSWPAAASATHGYNVYKITSSSITKLNGSPITGTSFTSTDNYTSGNKYMVTAVKLEITNSGTYYNESLGAIATVGGTVVGTQPVPTNSVWQLVTNGSTSQNMVSLWTASSDAVGVSGYNIFRSDTSIWNICSKNESPITLNFIATLIFQLVCKYNTYYYKVSAFTMSAGNQSNQSSSVSATTPSAPSGSQVLGINGPVGPSLTDNATSCTNPSGGTIYYVDAVAGNDSNNGTSTSTPWKTISKLNTASFSAGTMTCFKRGGVYPGTITLSVSGTQSSPLRFDAYGSGAAPIISGFDQVTTPWVTYSGNIWKTTIATGLSPKQLQVAGVVQNLARHPNTGWLQTTNKTSTTASGTWIGTQAANSLVGANIIEYANPWAWFKGQVTANSGSTVTFTPGAAIFDGDQAGWSYGLENKLSFLDSAGEWYYNSTTGELYFWAPGNANPNNLSIEISARVEGIYMTAAGARDTQFKNLVFEGYSGTVSSFGDQRRNVYENLEIRKSGKAIGVWSQATSATDGVLIKNNYIHNIYQDGIYFVGGNGQTIEGNVIKDIGIDPWYAGSGTSWSMIAINTGTSNQVIRRNIIENIGYTGVFVNGSGVVEENHLKNMLVSVTDGAAIMFNIADGLSIRKNIIEEVYSQNMSAMPLPYPTYPPNGISNGIYYGDDTIKNTTVENNVVANVGNDAYVMDHGNEYINNRTINNIGFNFGRGGIFFSDASIYRDIGPSYGASYMQLCLPYENSACFRPQFNDIVTGNKLYGSKPDQLDASGRNGSRGIYMFYVYSNGTGAHVDYGTINNNYYYNRLSANRVTTRWPVIGPFTTTDYTMSAWRTFSGEDANSTESTYPASSTRPEPDIYLNPTASPITRSVNGCTSNNTPLTGVQTIQPFSALVVEYGNC